MRRLAARADVLVQNFRPGVVERLGIAYEALAAANPALVYVSISGFGETGPLAGARSYDPIVQALSGLTSIQGGSDERRPALVRTIVPDKVTGLTAAQAACAALVARGRTGRGQHVRVSMLDSVLAFLWASDFGGQTFADQPVQPQKAASFIDLIYETADGYMTVSTMGDSEWQGFCRAVGRPDWLDDERFATPAARDEHVDARLERVQSALRAKTTAEWLEVFAGFDVPCAPVLTRNEVPAHPQVLASGSVVESRHPLAGRLRQARSAPRYEATPSPPPRGAPGLGEHNGEILRELGYAAAEIEALIAQGAVGGEHQDGTAAAGGQGEPRGKAERQDAGPPAAAER